MSKLFAGFGMGMLVCFCILTTLAVTLPKETPDISGLAAIPAVVGAASIIAAFISWAEGH